MADRAANCSSAISFFAIDVFEEFEHYRKDGSTFWCEATAQFVLDKHGNPIGLTGITRDISDKRRVEGEKEKLEAQLQEAQRIEALGNLAGGIAHDFNNLLMGIQGRSSLLLVDKDSVHPDFEHLKGIEDYIKSAADLTKQLLGFARSGKYDVKVTDLNYFVKKSAGMFGRTKKEIVMHPKYQEGIWSVEVDQGQIEQVLLNSLDGM